MLSRSHAAHAALTNWRPTTWREHAGAVLQATWRPVARVANHAFRNAVTRRELAELDDRMLADIGITRSVALAEINRLPWDDRPRRREPGLDTQSGTVAGQSIWQRAGVLWQRHRSRQRIAALDAEMLKDIGVSFSQDRGRGQQAVLARLTARAGARW